VSHEPSAVCRALSKTYVTASGGIEALHSVEASFALGELTAIVGASGSGKSTLLRGLAGLDRPTSGSIVVADRELADASSRLLREHRQVVVTFVNQKPAENFVPHLTVREQGKGAAELLGDFGLAHRLDSTPAELSGGEQARAAFALALARATPFVLADEPTAELDRGTAKRLLDAIRRHATAGVGFIVATHDPDVIAVADRVLLLDRGRVVEGDAVRPIGRSPVQVAADADVVLRAAGVRKSYRVGGQTVEALRDGTVDLVRGEVGALLGRSGSGKSTLLTLLAGLFAPDGGEIRYLAGEPATLSWGELAFLPQRFGLLPELTVRENVGLPSKLQAPGERRLPRPTAVAAVEDLLERLGLGELADRFPNQTSIGQQQRTALARALALGPTVLLADEPTSHQDAGWRDRVWEVLAEAATAGTSCLVATHEEEIARYATHVWRVEEGSITPTARPPL
jgi:putative ABC transport system ATP-binding protein